MRKTTTIKKCEGCGKEMLVPFWKTKRIRFCSKLCNGTRVRRETAIKYQAVCKTCGKNFIKDHASKGLFCSRECYWKSKIIYGEKPKCLVCGISLSTHTSLYCHGCFVNFRKGENHPGWIKDRTQLAKRQERGDSAYREWRIQVYKRDNFKCKLNNKDCKGRLEAHHILGWFEFPALRYEVNNGITLCHAHHPRVRAEEKRLSPYFQDLVSVSNEKF